MNQFKCLLTGLDVDVEMHDKMISYNLTFADNSVQIFVCKVCKNEIVSSTPKHFVKGLIANGIWPNRSLLVSERHKEDYVPPTDCVTMVVDNYLNSVYFPKNPVDRMDNLLLNIFKLQNEDGQRFIAPVSNEKIYIKNYFKTPTECFFYLKGLEESGLIKLYENGYGLDSVAISISHLGLNRVAELRREGINSNECFVAMAFDDETIPVRDAIKRALLKTGFHGILIDESHLSSDKSIPDGIFSSIKRSKFCIADFSFHRHGVYFESGFALGLGKPVIYLCSKPEFPNAHFDIKQLQQIIYGSVEELESRLIDKIEAWIKDAS